LKEEEKPVKKPPAKPVAPKKSKIEIVKKKESSPQIKIE